MYWPLALRAEIIHHDGEARAKELFPEPVHHGPRSERVVARDQPLCQVEPGEPLSAWGRNLRQEMRHGRLDDLAILVLPVAARQHTCDHRIPGHGYDRGRFAAAKFKRLAAQRLVLGEG